LGAVVAGAVDLAERPLAFEGLLVSLDLSVDLRPTGWDQEMPDAAAGEELGERSVVGVGPRVVAHQPLDLDALRGEGGKTALEEAGDGRCSFVAVELAVGVARVVVDE
jgi:hypothetical protein